MDTDSTAVSVTGSFDERTRLQRARLRSRHAQGITTLMVARTDLRGVHALADFVDDAVRWSV